MLATLFKYTTKLLLNPSVLIDEYQQIKKKTKKLTNVLTLLCPIPPNHNHHDKTKNVLPPCKGRTDRCKAEYIKH